MFFGYLHEHTEYTREKKSNETYSRCKSLAQKPLAMPVHSLIDAKRQLYNGFYHWDELNSIEENFFACGSN